jgi:predicted MFS family arabinose efflux permease
VRRARWAILAAFFIHGAVFASWVPLIPAVQQALGLSASALGLALLGTALGSLLTMPLTGRAIARRGSRWAVRVLGLAYCASLALPVLAPSLPTLVLALLIFGAAQGASDVAINAQGVAVEARWGRPLMSALHGLWSLGAACGAAASGLLATAGLAPLPRVLVPAIVLAGALALAARYLLPDQADTAAPGPTFARLTRPLLALGLIGICAYMAEGAIGDWSAVYLRRSLGVSAGLAAAGYATFTLCMTIGRLGGDYVTARLGPVRLVRVGGAGLAVGLGAALLIGQTAATLVGFTLIGLALANVVPLVFSAAGKVPHLAPGAGIAAVGTAIYLGILLGPPLIGVTADHLTLRGALGLVALLGVAIALLAPAVAPATGAAGTGTARAHD